MVTHQFRLRQLLGNTTETASVSVGSEISDNILPIHSSSSAPYGTQNSNSEGNNQSTSSSQEPASTTCSRSGAVDLHEEITLLNKENLRLQSLCTNLHSKHRQSSLRVCTSFSVCIAVCGFSQLFPNSFLDGYFLYKIIIISVRCMLWMVLLYFDDRHVFSCQK